jgi:pimeloyl-ACP methyl ester carboxylesterase
MGGYLVSAYALEHPERVAHLILADPWGFPAEDNLPLWMRPVKFISGLFNPMMASRLPGRLGLFT